MCFVDCSGEMVPLWFCLSHVVFRQLSPPSSPWIFLGGLLPVSFLVWLDLAVGS